MTSPLAELVRLAEKATDGEWRIAEEDDEFTESGCTPDWYVQAVCGDAWDNVSACGGAAYEDGWKYTAEQRKANAEFICAARNSIAALKALLASNQWITGNEAPDGEHWIFIDDYRGAAWVQRATKVSGNWCGSPGNTNFIRAYIPIHKPQPPQILRGCGSEGTGG